MSFSTLWELADQFEDRSKDKTVFGPLQRWVWREAWKELTERLPERRAD